MWEKKGIVRYFFQSFWYVSVWTSAKKCKHIVALGVAFFPITYIVISTKKETCALCNKHHTLPILSRNEILRIPTLSLWNSQKPIFVRKTRTSGMDSIFMGKIIVLRKLDTMLMPCKQDSIFQKSCSLLHLLQKQSCFHPISPLLLIVLYVALERNRM